MKPYLDIKPGSHESPKDGMCVMEALKQERDMWKMRAEMATGLQAASKADIEWADALATLQPQPGEPVQKDEARMTLMRLDDVLVDIEFLREKTIPENDLKSMEGAYFIRKKVENIIATLRQDKTK